MSCWSWCHSSLLCVSPAPALSVPSSRAHAVRHDEQKVCEVALRETKQGDVLDMQAAFEWIMSQGERYVAEHIDELFD